MAEIRPYRYPVGLSFLLAALSTGGTLYIPVLIGRAIDLILGEGRVDFQGLTPIILQMLIAIAVVALSQWGMNFVNSRVVYRITKNLRDRAFSRIESLPLSYLDAHPYGDVVSRMVSDVDHFSDGLFMVFTQLFTGILTILGTLVFMFVLNWKIALSVVALTPFSLLIARFIANKSGRHFERQAKARGEETGFVNEMITNEKTVRAYGQESRVLKRFHAYNDALRRHSLKALFFSSLVNPSTRFIHEIIYVAVALIGILSILKSGDTALTVGGLTVFLAYTSQYAKPFNEISGVITELKNAFVCAERVYELLETPVEEETAFIDEQALRNAPKSGYFKEDTSDEWFMPSDVGEVEFRDVSFSYDPEKPLIRHFSLHVNPGEHVAIVGRTGAGKTTLVNLLLRFYEVNEGEILVDGHQLRDLTREELREKFGMVLQETWVRAGTVYDNIRIGKPGATEEEVREAAKKAHADEFIRRLKDGYDTVLSENGDGLSEGEKQLLCIARVMLAMPPILILDEATSSIDTRTEQRIQQAFNTLMEGRTSFVVAHRLSTIEHADRILVMADGKVAEQGTHEELLKKRGIYEEIYNSQFKGIAV